MTQTWTRAKVPRLFLESLIPNLQNPIPETLNPKITIPRHKNPLPQTRSGFARLASDLLAGED